MVDRILRVYAECPGWIIDTGKAWYPSAAKLACRIAGNGIGAGLIAALSPNSDWSTNVRIARKVADGYDMPGANAAKAKAILAGIHPLAVLRGCKVVSFWHNLNEPNRTDHVTIDRWAGRIVGVDAVTPENYATIARAYRIAGRIVGLTGAEIQAITWVRIRLGRIQGVFNF